MTRCPDPTTLLAALAPDADAHLGAFAVEATVLEALSGPESELAPEDIAALRRGLAEAPEDAPSPERSIPEVLHAQALSSMDTVDREVARALGAAGGDPARAGDQLGLDADTFGGHLERMRRGALASAIEAGAPTLVTRHNHPLGDALARQFVEGRLPPWEALPLRAALAHDQAGRRLYDALVMLEQVLEQSEGVPHLGVARAVRLEALVRRAPNEDAPDRRTPALLGGAVIVLAALAIFILRGTPPPDEAETRPGWSVFRAIPGEVTPLGATLAYEDSLLFTYTNPAESPWRHWLVAGRDAAGRYHQYHPQVLPDGAPTSGLAGSSYMFRGVSDQPLRRLVYAKHAPGPLEICVMFFERRRHLETTRQRLEAGDRWPEDRPIECRQVEVQRPLELEDAAR